MSAFAVGGELHAIQDRCRRMRHAPDVQSHRNPEQIKHETEPTKLMGMKRCRTKPPLPLQHLLHDSFCGIACCIIHANNIVTYTSLFQQRQASGFGTSNKPIELISKAVRLQVLSKNFFVKGLKTLNQTLTKTTGTLDVQCKLGSGKGNVSGPNILFRGVGNFKGR